MPTWAWVLISIVGAAFLSYAALWIVTAIAALRIIRKANDEFDKNNARIARWQDAMDLWEKR